jgi:uncharacterized membrane protein
MTLPHESKPPARLWLQLSFVMVLAAFFRFYDIGGSSLWVDELWSIEMSVGRGSVHDHLPTGEIQTAQVNPTSLQNAPPWSHIWNSLDGVTTAPLYIILLRWWVDLLGNSPAAVRSLSALFSLAAVLVLFDICRILHGSQTALRAAALMAVSVAQIDFGQEARNYPLLILLSLLACDCLVRIETRGAKSARLFALWFCLCAAVLTHYFAVLSIAALFAYSILRLRGRDRSRAFCTFAAAALFVAVAWGPQLIRQFRSLPSLNPQFLRDSAPTHATRTLELLLGLPGEFFCGDIFYNLYPHAALLATAIAAIVVAPLPIIYIATRRRDMLIWIIWLISILGILTCLDIVHHSRFLEYFRYSILASPAAYAMLAASRRSVVILTLIVCTSLAAVRALDGIQMRGDLRQFVQAVDTRVASNQVLAIYHHDPYLSPGMWYMAIQYYDPHSTRPWLLLREPIDESLQSQLRARGTFWFASADAGSQARKIVPGWTAAEIIPTPVCTLYRLVPQNPSTSQP